MEKVSSEGTARAAVVDVHAHILPSGLVRELKNFRGHRFPGVGSDGTVVFDQRSTPVPPQELMDVERRLRDMDRMGVAMQVVSPWVELNPNGTCSREPEFLELLNDAVAADVARYPQRLRGLGLVSRRDPNMATREMVRVAAIRGMVGVEITAGGDGPALHTEPWERFWHTASELGCLVLLHPWLAESRIGVELAGVCDIVDNPAQTSATVTALLLAGVIQRHPGLNLCLVHGGGVLPYHLGRLLELGAPLCPESSLGAGVRQLWFDSLTHSSGALAFLAHQMGADRVLLGTDYPFRTGDPEGVGRVRRAEGLTGEQTAAILGGNAGRLLTQLDTL